MTEHFILYKSHSHGIWSFFSGIYFVLLNSCDSPHQLCFWGYLRIELAIIWDLNTLHAISFPPKWFRRQLLDKKSNSILSLIQPSFNLLLENLPMFLWILRCLFNYCLPRAQDLLGKKVHPNYKLKCTSILSTISAFISITYDHNKPDIMNTAQPYLGCEGRQVTTLLWCGTRNRKCHLLDKSIPLRW